MPRNDTTLLIINAMALTVLVLAFVLLSRFADAQPGQLIDGLYSFKSQLSHSYTDSYLNLLSQVSTR
ncbi:MAG: hypothetical protein R3276_09395 [Marinobacter sp.]|nr:hypothetical protein [Marinobacter sp.]